MKNKSSKPGFEFSFYMGLLLLIILPAMVFAQQDRHTNTIIIKNGDTIINGKKAIMLNPDEKSRLKAALADTGDNPALARWLRPRFEISRHRRIADSLHKNGSIFYTDSAGVKNEVRTYSDNRRPAYLAPDRMPVMRPDMQQFRMPVMGGLRRDRRDVDMGEKQDFDFNSVDKNGISTSLNFHVATAPTTMVKKLTGTEKAELPLVNLIFVPEFSSGKTLMMFSLTAGTPADVSFTDTDGNKLWSDKATGNKFTKMFALPLNGIYYLVVKQAGKTAVRQVTKE